MTNNESIWDKINSNFAQGGSVNKENRMYAEGGFLDDGASVDPVSGNEVPSGSLSEEVRDDVPAQLSEGEFVVPADVVRYIGLEKLMKMRESAKVGLANMEADGQMGGQPVPIMEDPMMDESMEMDALIDGMDSEGFDGAVQQFAKGGSVRGYDDGGDVELPSYESYTGRTFDSPDIIQQVKYVNAAGEFINIPTLKGQPLKAIPEGYSIYVPPKEGEETTVAPVEGDVVSGPDTTASSSTAQDFARNGGREERDAKIVVSNQLQRERIKDISALAGADLSQAGVNRLYESLTPQARDIYDKRFRDPSGPDSFMTKGMSSADMLIAAQKTADTLNNRRGVIEIDNESMYSTDPTTLADIAKAAALIAKGVTLDPLGMLTGFLTGSMSDEEESTATKLLTSFGSLFEASPFSNKDGGVGNQPTTTGFKVPKFNQAHWVSRMGELNAEGMTQSEIQRKLFQEQQSIPALFGVTAYGQSIPEDSLNTDVPTSADIISNKYDEQDKKQRTLDEISRKQAAARKEKKIQAELLKVEAEAAKAAQAVKDNNAKQDAASIAAAKKKAGVDRIAREESVRKAAENKATQDALREQARLQGDRTPSDNKGGPKGDNSWKGGQDKKGNDTRGGEVTSGTTGKNTTGNKFNYGGVVTSNKPKIKKMRNDPTAGLASKKIAKQKAQAKKGALAAKRT